jgi:fructokinase
VNWRPTFWDEGAAPDAGPTPGQIDRIRPLLEQVSLIKCAAEEAAWLFDSDDAAAIQAALPRRPAVLITDGGRPLRWCMGGRSGRQPAFDVPVVDTTGAGDAFTAGLLHGLCRNPSLLADDGTMADPDALARLMAFASACGALVCGAGGAIAPQPTESEVEAFLSR